MNPFRRRRYTGAAAARPAARGGVTLPVRDGSSLRLNAVEARLAQAWDGQRDEAAVLAVAAELGLSLNPEQLERFAAELAMAGWLEPGRDEPLPSPPYSDVPLSLAGDQVAPPSTLPGSLAGPGLMGSLLRLLTDRSSLRHRHYRPIPAGPWAGLGRWLIWPLFSRAALLTALGLLALLLFGVWSNRYQAGEELMRLFSPGKLALAWVLAWLLLQVVTVSARAAAVVRCTGQAPKTGLLRSPFGLPMLYLDSSGVAEAADRAGRLRIVGAGLIGPLVLTLACLLTWLLMRAGPTLLGAFSLAIASVGLVVMLVRSNPLMRTDGYFLLAQWLDIPNLREQAMFASRERRGTGWSPAQRVISRQTLYFYRGLALANSLLLLGVLMIPASHLTARFGALGLIPLTLVLGVSVSQTFRNARTGANLNLGQLSQPPFWQRPRRFWITLAVLAVLAVVPYRYHPSGDFVVLPGERADVRALTAGDVRQVLVKEGDTVKAGQVIARLADDEARAAVASGEARLAQLKADLSLAGKGGKPEEVEVARSALDTAQKRAEVSAAQAQRVYEAFRRKSVTPQDYDRVRGQADVDQKALQEARRRLDLVRSPAVSDRIAAIEAQMREVQAQLVFHREQLAYAQVKAPIAGVVVSGSLQHARGQFLNRGDLLAVIEDSRERLAEVRVPEAAISEIAVGKQGRARVWAFPASSFVGEVKRIAPAAEEGAYGMVVRVQVALEDPEQRLLPGMTGNAKLQGDWHPAIVVFSRALVRFLFVELWSWIP